MADDESSTTGPIVVDTTAWTGAVEPVSRVGAAERHSRFKFGQALFMLMAMNLIFAAMGVAALPRAYARFGLAGVGAPTAVVLLLLLVSLYLWRWTKTVANGARSDRADANRSLWRRSGLKID